MYNSTNKTDGIQLLKSKREVAQAKERAKIGQEIQENLNQVLIAALLYIDQAKTDDENREICLDRSSSFISSVIKELADISQTLQSGILI